MGRKKNTTPLSITEHKIKMKGLADALRGRYQDVVVEVKEETDKTITVSTVSRVLSNDYVNWDVIKAAIKVRDRLVKMNKLTEEKQKSILNKI